MASYKALKKDIYGNPIQSAVNIDDILNISITAGAWTAVPVPAGICVKSVYITTRDGSNFLLSHLVAGTRYSTLPSGFGVDIAKEGESTMFYVKGTSSTMLEVILLG